MIVEKKKIGRKSKLSPLKKDENSELFKFLKFFITML